MNAVARIFEVLADVVVFDRWIVEVVEVIYDCDTCVVTRKQPIDEMRPDKPRAK